MPRQAVCAFLGPIAGLLCCLLVAAPANANIPGGHDQGAVAYDSSSSGDSDLFARGPDGTVRRFEASMPGAEDARPAWAPEPSLRVDTLNVSLGEIKGRGFATADYFWPPAEQPPSAVVALTLDGKPVPFEVQSDDTIKITSVPAGTTENSLVCVTKRAGLAVAPSFTVTGLNQTTTSPGFQQNFVGVCPAQPIAFQSNRSGDYEIWLYDPAQPVGAGNPVDISQAPGAEDTAPAWSPAEPVPRVFVEFTQPVEPSPLLAFVSDRRGNRDIFVLDPALPLSPTNPAPLTTSPADDANPEWSPDGRSIVFESDRDGPKDIWTMDVVRSGSTFLTEQGLRQITADDEPAYDPTWYTLGSTSDMNAVAFAGPEGNELGPCQLNLVSWSGQPAPPPSSLNEETVDGHADSPAFTSFGDAISVESLRGGNDDIWDYTIPDPNGTDQPTWSLLIGSGGVDRHPNWQATPWPAVVIFHPPRGRASRRRNRKHHGTAQAFVRPCDSPPSPAFSVTPTSPEPNAVATFDASASTATGGRFEAYEWDFDGDGTFEDREAGPTVSHTFPQAGIYPITLRVVDEQGDSARVRRSVSVSVGPSDHFSKCTILGTAGDDVLRGTSKADVICGLGGDDVIYGLSGNDWLDGGGGSDKLLGGPGRDLLLGRGGGDRMSGEPGADDVRGGAGPDRGDGGAGNDRIWGEAGDDRLFGGSGRDRLTGGRGRDRLRGDAGADRLFAHDRTRDRVSGGPARDRARIDGGLDIVVGVEVVHG